MIMTDVSGFERDERVRDRSRPAEMAEPERIVAVDEDFAASGDL